MGSNCRAHHIAGEPDAPLKIEMFHADIARGERECPRIEMIEIGDMVMPRQWYMKSIDQEGTLLLSEVHADVKRQAEKYYHPSLVITHMTKDEYSLPDAMDINE